jgi:hypothetical protein
MTSWHIITGEYPAQPGGVADYTRSVARGLAAAGELVTVWAPPFDGRSADDAGVTLRRLPDHFGRAALAELGAALDREAAPRRMLVQYVPQAFGWKGLNVPFCWWLRSRRRDSVWVMFHEVAFPIDRRQTVARNAVGVITRRMAAAVAGSAARAFVSIPAWTTMLRQLAGPAFDAEWLPVPSAIPVVDAPGKAADIRRQIGGGRRLAGHFGTYGDATRALLEAALTELLALSDCAILLVGRGSEEFARQFHQARPHARGRVHATGELPAAAVSTHLSACDVLVQPYPDGISTRRTSAMAALGHARPVASTEGWLTEPLWRHADAVALTPAGDARALAGSAARLLADPSDAARLAQEGRRLYESRFDIAHTIEALLRADEANSRVA